MCYIFSHVFPILPALFFLFGIVYAVLYKYAWQEPKPCCRSCWVCKWRKCFKNCETAQDAPYDGVEDSTEASGVGDFGGPPKEWTTGLCGHFSQCQRST